MAVPKGIVKSDESVKLLTNILQKTKNDLLNVVTTAEGSKRQRASVLIREIDNIIQESTVSTNAWSKVATSGIYSDGMDEALKSLTKRNSPIKYTKSLVGIHKESLEYLVTDNSTLLGAINQDIKADAVRFVNTRLQSELNEKIQKGFITGSGVKKIAKDLKKTILEGDSLGLTDSAGRNWDVNRYTEMLARTKLTQAQVEGTVKQMQGLGYDLAIVSDHSGECELCRPYERMVVSVSGTTKGYISLDEAKAGGLFHPNCRHTITAYSKAYLDTRMIYSIDEGRMVPASKWVKTEVDTLGNFNDSMKENKVANSSVFYRDTRSKDKELGRGNYYLSSSKLSSKGARAFLIAPTARVFSGPVPEDTRRFLLDNKDKYDLFKFDDGTTITTNKNTLVDINKNTIRDLEEPTELSKYVNAYNKEDVKTMEELRKEYPDDVRFRFHLVLGEPTENGMSVGVIDEKHQQALEDLGIDKYVEFVKRMERGASKKDLQEIVDSSKGEVRKTLERLIDYV